MILPNPKDIKHKIWLYRLLSAISDDQILPSLFYFKGGTCAAMRNLLDRFSVDLDFDFIGKNSDLEIARKKLEKIFLNLGLEIKEKSQKVPQYFLKYPAVANERNTIKIDATMPPPKSNKYEAVRFFEIDRIINCQTKETMFANKLVACIDRFEKNKSIAGRDIYDIHYFFIEGLRYEKNVILERRNIKNLRIFFQELSIFIKKNISQTIINQDINFLLSYEKFNQVRKILKNETLMFIDEEIKRITKNL
ncbi:MAG: nucleotidyl transferase AbiEii/AbiGii toxin family protein [Candidatus Kuenenbacteria bacterium]